jgi:hypothetical protein
MDFVDLVFCASGKCVDDGLLLNVGDHMFVPEKCKVDASHRLHIKSSFRIANISSFPHTINYVYYYNDSLVQFSATIFRRPTSPKLYVWDDLDHPEFSPPHDATIAFFTVHYKTTHRLFWVAEGRDAVAMTSTGSGLWILPVQISCVAVEPLLYRYVVRAGEREIQAEALRHSLLLDAPLGGSRVTVVDEWQDKRFLFPYVCAPVVACQSTSRRPRLTIDYIPHESVAQCYIHGRIFGQGEPLWPEGAWHYSCNLNQDERELSFRVRHLTLPRRDVTEAPPFGSVRFEPSAAVAARYFRGDRIGRSLGI